FYVQEMTRSAVAVRVPYGALEAIPKQRGDTETVSPSQPTTGVAGVHETSGSIPQSAENATKPELSDIDLVITTARRLETLLETHFAAKGRGLHEKITSVKEKIAPHIVRPAYYVAITRNRVLHQDGFVLRHREKFLRCAEIVDNHLRV